MTHIDAGMSFFLQDTSFLAKGDPNARHFPDTLKMKRGQFQHGEESLPYFYSRAKREKAVVVGCSGLNTHVLLGHNEVCKLNDAGISVIWLALPPARHKQGAFMDGYIDMAKEFFTGRHSPARFLFPNDTPRHVMTHSTGGLLYWTIKQTPEISRKLQSTYSSETHIAPYLDSANASRHHSPTIRRKAFEIYSKLHANDTPLETLLGRAYLAIKALGESFTSSSPDISPTFGQIRQVQAAGRRLTDTFNPESCGRTPCTVILGERDPFACAKTSKDFASLIGAKLHLVAEGGHAPLHHAPEIFDNVVHDIVQHADRYYADRCVKAEPSPFWKGIENSLDLEFSAKDWLSYGAGIALQRGTRLLDTTTGLFQRLLGRGVGDAEVRREPERLTLNSGDAFGFEQIGNKIAVALDDLAVGGPFADASGARRVDVEGSLGLGAINATRFVQHRHDQISAGLK